MPPQIILCTLNARYIHASLGLRYLKANLNRHGRDGLEELCVLREYTIKRPVAEIVGDLLSALGDPLPGQAQLVGFGVYIWNVEQTSAVIQALRLRRPALKIILGGPEVSHEVDGQDIVALADHVITGWGDVSFAKLCKALIDGPAPLMKVCAGEQAPLDEIEPPYALFSDTDLRERILYVEASRGCPFKCEFCLSALDKTAWAFELPRFIASLDGLYQRGARQFKFVDRTFNLKVEASAQILEFFLRKLQTISDPALIDLRLHFEVVPDHLPERLKALLCQFPPGVLQLEIGIQTLNPVVQKDISRKQDNALALANLRWLLTNTHAHLHVDLIFGLPGETLQSFGQGFDQLLSVGPHEIQLGLLKRLRGAPIARHTQAHQMVYDSQAPYTVLQTAVVSAQEVTHFARLARYWDLIANSGRFKDGLVLLLGLAQNKSAFLNFWDFSLALWSEQQRAHQLTPETLLDALFNYLCSKGLPANEVRQRLLSDYLRSGAKNQPECLRGLLSKSGATAAQNPFQRHKRQRQHLVI